LNLRYFIHVGRRGVHQLLSIKEWIYTLGLADCDCVAVILCLSVATGVPLLHSDHLTLPVALIGTLAAILYGRFSIKSLTLLAVVSGHLDIGVD